MDCERETALSPLQNYLLVFGQAGLEGSIHRYTHVVQIFFSFFNDYVREIWAKHFCTHLRYGFDGKINK